MADNTLVEIVDGDIATAADVNQILTALKETQYPRSTDGSTTNESGSLGTAIKRFLEAHVKDIVASSINVGSINENVGLTPVKQSYTSNDTFVIPNGVTKIYLRCSGQDGIGGLGLYQDLADDLYWFGAGGGAGGEIALTLPVESGDTINISAGIFGTSIERVRGAFATAVCSTTSGQNGSNNNSDLTKAMASGGKGGTVTYNQALEEISIQYIREGGSGGHGGYYYPESPSSSTVTSIGLAGGSNGGRSGNTNNVDGSPTGFVTPSTVTLIYWS